MQKAQRLLDLAAFLLRAAEPVSWREIQEQFPEDYGRSSGEAAIRKFERDKAELLELGIPIRYAAGDEDLPAGYLIDRDEFYLPDLKLPPEDLALLYLAGSAALAKGSFPYARDLAHALNKLSFAARAPGAEAAASVGRRLSAQGDGEGEATDDERGIGALLEELSRAVALKKRVHLAYEGAERRARTERDVDPYGLYQKAGAWYVVGWCHLRRAIRTFSIGRIRSLAVNASAPRTPDFAPRKDFRLAEYATREAWEFSVHAPQRCRVRLDAPIAPELVASFGPRAQVREEAQGAVVELDATNGEALVRHVLSLGDRAEILAPKALRDHARAILRALARGLS
ncbi:MAG TPA: WYL domain-containing protein [Anaeromyxobacteraceae bacterium]|nr:WYL domain-containing protein [Anaeromyxobacteraceae bacterium]